MTTINQQPFYLSDKSNTLFCWMHTGQSYLPSKDCAVIVCNPFGYEYIRSHRSVRHFADTLADAGFITIRFDYAGTGDSSGDDLDEDRIGVWKQNIRDLIAYTKKTTGCANICLVGIRMGATLAALIASENEISISHLILWSPCVQGRHYVREMKALAFSSAPIAGTDTNIESAGFILTAETIEQITSLNIESLSFPKETSMLLIDRDDRQQYMRLLKKWTQGGCSIDYLVLSGYLSMFAEPHETVVPVDTIGKILEWLTKNSSEATSNIKEHSFDLIKQADIHSSISEQLCHFGSRNQLFGVLATPLRAMDRVLPTVVLLNAGSVHHVGPQRIYAVIARALAAQGFPCFRFDFEGIGDSNLQNVPHENHPYQESALQDTESALHFLSERFSASQFIITGICSGAYTGFRFGLETTPYKIRDILLINPLTFYWEQGRELLMDAAKINAIWKIAHYKQSVYDIKQWIKLMKGEIPWRGVVKTVLAQIKLFLKSFYRDATKTMLSHEETRLSADIKAYLEKNLHLSFFLSDTDPGLDMILIDAKSVFRKGIKEKKIILQMFKDADHTFSHTKKRDELISRLIAHLEQVSMRSGVA